MRIFLMVPRSDFEWEFGGLDDCLGNELLRLLSIILIKL